LAWHSGNIKCKESIIFIIDTLKMSILDAIDLEFYEIAENIKTVIFAIEESNLINDFYMNYYDETSKIEKDFNTNSVETTLSSIADEILQGLIDKRFTLVYMLNYKHIRNILLWGYNFIINVKGIPPIEQISVQLKKEYWAEVQTLEIDRDEKIKAAKGLYFMAWRANFKK
jgi:hypothetical protein